MSAQVWFVRVSLFLLQFLFLLVLPFLTQGPESAFEGNVQFESQYLSTFLQIMLLVSCLLVCQMFLLY